MKNLKQPANISEVFASICGEGLHVGATQLFIRLASCEAECRLCSARGAPKADESFLMRPWPGPKLISVSNPVTPEKLLQKIEAAFPLNIFHSVSFIGGEPLCQPEYISTLAALLRKKGMRTYADTRATNKNDFLKLYPLIDYWSLTIGNPGTRTAMLRNNNRLAGILEEISPANCYLRLILNSDDDPEDYLQMFSQLCLEDYTLVVQPNSIAPARINDWDTGTILEWIKIFQPFFAQIRWIPQVHKLLRIP